MSVAQTQDERVNQLRMSVRPPPGGAATQAAYPLHYLPAETSDMLPGETSDMMRET
jgi:hypothetical protein